MFLPLPIFLPFSPGIFSCFYYFAALHFLASARQGFFKVLGKGHLPQVPIIVRAKEFSKLAEQKIRAAGGACLVCA